VGTLLFAAVGVVVQLKDALNTVWEVEAAKDGGIWAFVRTYIASLAGVLAVGFLLLVSLVLTSVLSAAGKFLATDLPEAALHVVGSLVSFGVITLLFAMMFKWLPNVAVRWRDVWLGAALTAALFEIGKLAIGLYIGKQALESTYGAAASLVVLLIWIYYSSQIVLMGAEFTRVHANSHGHVGTRDRPAAAVHPEDQLSDPVQAAVKRTPYAATALALAAGWLLGRMHDERTATPGAPPSLHY
jgi:membrane protein